MGFGSFVKKSFKTTSGGFLGEMAMDALTGGAGGQLGGMGSKGVPLDILNEAMGVEQKTVTRPDGSKQLVISKLPLTPEEQRIKDTVQQNLQQSLTGLQQLMGTNYSDFMDEQVVQDFEKYQSALLDRSFGKATQQQEEALAQRGISESTSGTEYRAALAGQQAEQREQAGLQTISFAQNLRQNKLAEAAQNVNIANALQTGQQANLAQGVSGAQSAASLGLQSQQLGMQGQMFNIQQQNQAKQQNMQLIGSLAGAGAMALSDRRAKENLVPIGKLDNGLIVYIGNYKEETGLDMTPQLFLIAQEVQEIRPEAVVEVGEYLAVNYAEAVK